MPGDPSTGERVHSTFLVGADGRNSWVAHRLGLARTGENPGNHLAFQLHLKGIQGVGGEVQIHGFAGGYAGLVGLGGGAANLCFTVEKSKVKEEISMGALFENYLYKNSHLREALRKCEVVGRLRSAYPVFFSPRRYYGDSFLLVGDAARVTEPVTGEGVYFALKSGILAADAINLALREQNGSVETFSSYKRLCQRAFSFRRHMNTVIRALIYRPSILTPLVRLSSKTSFPLRPLVGWLCRSGGLVGQSL